MLSSSSYCCFHMLKLRVPFFLILVMVGSVVESRLTINRKVKEQPGEGSPGGKSGGIYVIQTGACLSFLP